MSEHTRVTQAAASALVGAGDLPPAPPIRVTQAGVSVLTAGGDDPISAIRVTQAAASFLVAFLTNTAPTADTISATLAGPVLARIDVDTPGTGGVSRVLQRSATEDFANFFTIPQEGLDPEDLPETLYDGGGVPGARVYYRTALVNSEGTTYSNVVFVDFPAITEAPAKPTLTIEDVGVDFVLVSLSAPVLPSGHQVAALELVVYKSGVQVANETFPVPDPDDPDQPWREQLIDSLTDPGDSFTVAGRWISDATPDEEPTYVAGPYSDPEPFTLLEEPVEDEPTPEPEEAGTVTGLTLFDEWPIPQYNVAFTLIDPGIEHLSSFGSSVWRGGERINGQSGSAKLRYRTREYGAMIPGMTYRIDVSWVYWPPNQVPRVAAVRRTVFTLPLANAAPYFRLAPGQNITAPVTLEFDQHQHPEFEGHDVIADGAWPVEITRDGTTWTPLTEDARGTPYQFDPSGHAPGYAQFRVRNEPSEGDPSAWRLSAPVYLNAPTDRFWRLSGDDLTLNRFQTAGTGDWSEVGEGEGRRLRYTGGKGTGGFAALTEAGEPRTFEIVGVGQWATGHAGHWMSGFFSEMSAHWGVGAYLRETPYTALTARLRSGFGAWGSWIKGHIGEGGNPWWQNNQRYGRGTMRGRIGRYGPEPGANPAADTASAITRHLTQWLGGAASVVGVPLSPWYVVRERVEFSGPNDSGGHDVTVVQQVWGPDVDEGVVTLTRSFTAQEWECAPCGLVAISGSDNIIDFQALAVFVEDYGSCLLPIGVPGLDAVAHGSPCDPLVMIQWVQDTSYGDVYLGGNYTVAIYVAEAADPDNFTLIVEGLAFAVGAYGWMYEEPGTYIFRVELRDGSTVVDTSVTGEVTVGRARTLDDAMKELLAARQMNMRAWLFVEHADGEYRDWSSYLTGFEVRYHRDEAVGTGSVRIRREHDVRENGVLIHRASLAPDFDASPLNRTRAGDFGAAIDIGRRFELWVAQSEPDETPTFADHARIIFCGRIDEHDFSHPEASFQGRDIHGELMDTFIEEVRVYGAPEPGQPAHEAIEQILEDNSDGFALYVRDEVDAEFGLWEQEKALLLETLRLRGLEAGADVRGLWRDDNGEFPLTFYAPDRQGDTPEYVFSRHEWLEMTILSRSIHNIRNAIGGSFVNASGTRVVADTITDPISIEKYGRRYGEFELGTDSPVRTAAAFEKLQTAALLDLSEPEAELEIRTRMFWPAGLNRIYGFEADGIRFSEQRNFACVGYRHVYSKGQGSMDDTWETFLTCRGKPAAAQQEYLQREKRPEEPTDPTPPAPPDPNAMRITAFDAVFPAGGALDYPQVIYNLSWSVANPEGGASVSIDREITANGDGFQQVMTGLPTNEAFQPDVFTVPFGNTQIRWRVRVIVGGETVLSRTTGYHTFTQDMAGT